jgi:hypothetical protein
MYPKIITLLMTLCIIALTAVSVHAMDLDTTAFVDIVDGISITETTPLHFGDVALNDGTISVDTGGIVSDPNTISFDPSAASQGLFAVTSIAGGVYDISLAETIPVVGLLLDNFQISIDGAADEVGANSFVGVTLINAISALEVGADLTVDSAAASVGDNQAIGYRLQVNFN